MVTPYLAILVGIGVAGMHRACTRAVQQGAQKSIVHTYLWAHASIYGRMHLPCRCTCTCYKKKSSFGNFFSRLKSPLRHKWVHASIYGCPSARRWRGRLTSVIVSTISLAHSARDRQKTMASPMTIRSLDMVRNMSSSSSSSRSVSTCEPKVGENHNRPNISARHQTRLQHLLCTCTLNTILAS